MNATGLTTVPDSSKIVHPTIWKRLQAFGDRKINIAMVSSWGVKCGIAEYTKTLTSHLPKWCRWEVFPYQNITSISGNPDILHIQWEPGLCPNKDAIVNLVDRWKNKVVLTAHYYDDFFRKVLVPKADLTIVHDKREVKRKNHFYIVQGCPVFPKKQKQALRTRLGIPQSKKVITSFGFFMDWKKLEYAIPSFIPYVRIDPQLYLILLHSIHPKAVSYGQNVKLMIDMAIKSYGVKDQVRFESEFLEKPKINNYLQASDLGFLYADIANSTGSSAVMKEYVAGRCPVIASNISHYRDIDKGVIFVESGRLHKLYYKVLDTVYDENRLHQLTDEQEENYAQLNYKRISKTHAYLYREVLVQ